MLFPARILAWAEILLICAPAEIAEVIAASALFKELTVYVLPLSITTVKGPLLFSFPLSLTIPLEIVERTISVVFPHHFSGSVTL